MGLDISFNRQAAIAAGLVLSTAPHATEDEIHAAIQAGEDREYIDYLSSIEELVHIPGTDLRTNNGGVNSIVIRANKWGRIYAPMTEWLTANGITWSEF